MQNMKEVRFDLYCYKCKHYDKSEAEDPCWDCLNQGWNEDSHKPILFEESVKKKKETSRSKQVLK